MLNDDGRVSTVADNVAVEILSSVSVLEVRNSSTLS